MDPRTPPDDPQSWAARARELALALGFDRAGIAPAEPTAHSAFLREWVARGYAGTMDWIGRRLEERVDPRRVLASARSVVVTGFVYAPHDRPPLPPGAAEVSRYAGGEDYHDVLVGRLRALGDALEALAGRSLEQRAYVDTGPVLERALAARAGVGWIGKNSCVIDRELGSWLFLGVLLSELPMEPDAPVADHCGTCRACLDACPTDAFPEPYVLDATRCISYTTIELRGDIPGALREAHGSRVFGCDVCQEVCPWNGRRARERPADPLGLRERIAARPEWRAPTLAWLLSLSEDDWRAATRRTALRRAKHRGLLRNALVAAGNSGDPALLPHVRRHAEGNDALLADHARWALTRLEAGPPAGGPG